MSAVRLARHHGLTLVEMLVVIVLVALTATLVMQGIGQGLGLFRRVAADQGQVYRVLMSRQWVHETLGTAVANAPEHNEFIGEAAAVKLKTFRPLLGSEGIATDIEWTVRADRGLEYREDTQSITVAALPPVLRFEYQDANSRWQPRWPAGDSNQLPERIRLVFDDGDTLDVALLTQRTLTGGSGESAIDDE